MSSVYYRCYTRNSCHVQCCIVVTKNTKGYEEFWFDGKVIADFCEFPNPDKAIEAVVIPKWRRPYSYFSISTPNQGNPDRVFVSEPGLYALLVRSINGTAYDLATWLYDEALPPIRHANCNIKQPELQKKICCSNEENKE